METLLAQSINGLATGSLYALIVLGMNMLVLVRKVVHQGFANIIVMAMAMGWLALNHLGGSVVLSMIAMVLSAIIMTVLTEPLFRPLAKRNADLETVTLAMGIGIILTEIMGQYINKGEHIAFPAEFTGKGLAVGTGIVSISIASLLTLVGSLIIVAVLMWFMYRTRQGRAIRAMAQNLEVAKLLGIPFGRTGLLGFAIAGLIAGIIAILMAMNFGSAGAALGDTLAVKAIILVLFGGMGNLKGGMISALLMGFVEAMAFAYLPGRWTEAVFYGVIMVVILWKPNGLFGSRS